MVRYVAMMSSQVIIATFIIVFTRTAFQVFYISALYLSDVGLRCILLSSYVSFYGHIFSFSHKMIGCYR